MENIFQYYNHLGFFNPYYIENKLPYQFKPQISEVLKSKNDPNELDVTSIIGILSKGYIIGDRTLIKSVNKTPWFTKMVDDQWDSFDEIKFDEKNLDLSQIVDRLYHYLKEEVLEYIGTKKNIGVLLSGGMDSRMLAGVLDSLIKEGALTGVHIIAYTWGDLNCRDAVYSQKIAARLGWSWKHFDITAEDFINNIEMTAMRGSEYSPNHLHAMFKVRAEKDVDCILAASFGDSIGRGEYSGKSVLKLEDLRFNISNDLGFIKDKVYKKTVSAIDDDILRYWQRFPQQKKHQQIEQDYQIHYMRRCLNPCLSAINEKISVYQVFSSPKILKMIWSLDPAMRNNDIYKGLLKKFRTELGDIPWARTGLKFDDAEGVPDNYLGSYERQIYSKIINEEIFDYIKGLVLSESIQSLEVFNDRTLKKIFKIMQSPFYTYNIGLEEKLTWLASLSLFVSEYNVQHQKAQQSEDSLRDLILSDSIVLENCKFSLKTLYRRKYLKIRQ